MLGRLSPRTFPPRFNHLQPRRVLKVRAEPLPARREPGRFTAFFQITMSEQAIYARFGFDLKGARKDLADAHSMVKDAHGKMAQSAHANSAAHEHLLGSTHRVARQIGSFSQTLLSGQDAAGVFIAGMEGVERALHLPLGALASLAIGAILAEEIHKVGVEAEKVATDIARITNEAGQGADFSSLDALKQRLEEIHKEADELKKGHSDGTWTGMFSARLHQGEASVGKALQGDFSNFNPFEKTPSVLAVTFQ